MMFNFLQKNRILIIILIFAGVLRIWDLGGMPPHLRNDEAALGYNAYSILKTFKDEHGNFLPLIFKSFGDWKMGMYVYLTVPFIAVLGLNELAVRMPSILAGIISVWLLFLITKHLFEKRVATLTALLLAISPVMMPFSRGAWEINISFVLTLGGIYFFLKSFKKKSLIFLSSIFFGLTLISSHGAKFTTPIILIVLSLLFLKEVKNISQKFLLISILIMILFSMPVILSFSQDKASRITTLSIFSYPNNDYLKAILSRWMSLYSIKTLFIRGDFNPQHGASDTGPFLLIEGIFLFGGLTALIKKGFSREAIFIWLSLFLLSLPSAFTIEKANFVRAQLMFVPLIIIEAMGINYLWQSGTKVRWRFYLFFIVVILYVINYTYFIDQYFVHNPKKNDAWQYGYKQIVEKVTPIQGNYNQVIVQKSLEQPHIFFLFYQKYDPLKYQRVIKEVFVPNPEGKDMGTVSRVDNIYFSDINWKEKVKSKTLYVMPKYLFDSQSKNYNQFKEIDTVYDLNGFPLFKLVETQ